LRPERQDEEKHEVFWNNSTSGPPIKGLSFGSWMKRESKGIPARAAAGRNRANPGPCRIWAILSGKRGGTVCQHSGEFFSLIVESMDTEIFQAYLDELAKVIPEKKISGNCSS
jgi:hypothetical protein